MVIVVSVAWQQRWGMTKMDGSECKTKFWKISLNTKLFTQSYKEERSRSIKSLEDSRWKAWRARLQLKTGSIKCLTVTCWQMYTNDQSVLFQTREVPRSFPFESAPTPKILSPSTFSSSMGPTGSWRMLRESMVLSQSLLHFWPQSTLPEVQNNGLIIWRRAWTSIRQRQPRRKQLDIIMFCWVLLLPFLSCFSSFLLLFLFSFYN